MFACVIVDVALYLLHKVAQLSYTSRLSHSYVDGISAISQ